MNPFAPPLAELHLSLRQATKQAHHVLDRHPLLAPLLMSAVSAKQYGNALTALHGVYDWAERWVDRYLDQYPGEFDYATRRKLPALEADLAALGRHATLARLNLVIPLRLGSLVGILYTIEGSTMGAQVIARRLRQFAPELPLRFYSGYGDQSRQKWDAFLHFAQTSCPNSEQPAALAASVGLFEAIKTHLDAVFNEITVSEMPACAL